MQPKHNYSRLSKAVRGVLTIATASMLISQPSFAAEVDEDKDSEKIVVTGSRIERSSAQMTTPTTVIDSKTIEQSGVKNIGDLLHRMPALLDGIGSNNINDNGASGGTADISQGGLENANLRGLGVNRTLVLVNGRRHVPGSSTSSAVDLAMIPATLIERIEIITGGASAIYGADAVTGVINIILKSDFEGTLLDVSAGTTAESDGDSQNLAITWGSNFSDGKGNITLHATYSDDEEIPMSARDYANRDPGFLPNPQNVNSEDGIPDTIFAQDVRFQALSEEGLFYVPNANYQFGNTPITDLPFPTFANDPLFLPFGRVGFDTFTIDRDDGSFRPFVAGQNCGVVPCDGGDGFRTQETNTLKVPSERISFNASGRYDVNPDLRLFAEAKYGKTESAASGQASVFHDDNFGPLITIRSDNPFRPQELVTLMNDRNLDVVALAVVGLNSRSVNTRETTQFTFGGEGSFGGNYDYNFYVQHGKVEGEFLSQDLLNERYYEALDAVADANGNPVCRSGNAACVAFNPINNLASREALNYASVMLKSDSEITQTIGSFSISGDWFEAPAGTAEFAAGIDYRRETAKSNPDPLSQARDADGIGSGLVGSTTGPSREQNSFILPVKGDYDVKELYAETIIPLVMDETLIDSLELEAAVRYADQSETGADTTYKTGINWGLNSTFRTRVTYSKAVRAPNIQELFAPQQISGAFVTDPCHAGNLASRPQDPNDPHRVNCAALGLAPDFQSQAAFGTRILISEGNPELNPEEAETLTVGFVVTPNNNFSFTADYWDIEITDAITNFDPNDILRNCVSGEALNPAFCGLINRDASGQIVNMSSQAINAAKFVASGTDVEARYTWELNSGLLSLSFNGTYLDKREFFQNPDDPEDVTSLAGQVGTPRFRALINTSYSNDDFSATWSMSYIGESTFNKLALPEQYPTEFDNKVEAFTYHNLNFNYRFTDDLSVYLGIDNVTNKEPVNLPNLNSGGLLYDGIGRKYYAGVQISL
ncbi:TonB-dependent receptor domain-containing protein [Aliikangiella coralliicola]|uniref:TonB-dependent receptor n=1 Tax=Aliikangiella coralliicola TaxID=2592383 RepID=A0A545UA72_9GAMM|nr:TonB-dependent receptor [Aliikangiella coralliicola]TQV86360.1 TonB-dependent receptor [Aliikangiella coralliicola]